MAARYGGPSTAVLDMCAALAGRGHEVELFTTTIDGPVDLDVPEGVPVDTRGFSITYFRAWRPRSYGTSPGLALALRRRIASFDVAHVHSLYLFHGAAAAFLARRAHVPYVMRPHGTLDAYHRAARAGRKAVYEALVERRNLDAAAAIHCTSRAEQRAIDALGFRAPTVVVPLGIHHEHLEREIDPAPLLCAHPELDGRTLVTALGRLTPKKGLDLLIDAFARLAEPGAHLVLAGPDDEGLGDDLRRRVEAHRLGGRVTFPGMVTGDAKIALLQRSAVFALPSEDENLGVALLEAMAAGVPVVTTRGVAIHEEVARAGAGLVVARTVDDLADALAGLLAEPERRRRLGAAGRRLVRSIFAWERLAPALEDMYAAARARR